MKRALVPAILVLAAGVTLGGESRTLGGAERSIPRPEGQAVDGPLPRPLFLAQVMQRNQLWDPAEKTTYFLLDPSRPAEGFRKVYEGPGRQSCAFLTPLFGGVGAAMGGVDPRRQESERRLFWFDLLGGRPGETIAREPWDEWVAGREVRFRAQNGIHRLDPVAGSLRSCPLDLSHAVLVGESKLLGVCPLDGRKHAVLADIVKETLDDLGELPGHLQAPGSYDRIFPAGPAARDGLVFVSGAVDDFALWYKPPDSRWLRVLRDVHIFKNFGGTAPWLPVAYLGDRRFAVAKTVKDKAPPEGENEDDPALPSSLSVTMLVEGMTGRILEETEPAAYQGNPRLDIPGGWWSKEAAGARRRRAEEPDASGAWRRGEEEKLWRMAGGKVVRPGEKEEASLSQDGRWLVIYSRWAEKGPPARIPCRLIDGTTGEERSFEISLPTREGFIDRAAWQVLASQTPGPDEIEKFRPARRDLFFDPW